MNRPLLNGAAAAIVATCGTPPADDAPGQAAAVAGMETVRSSGGGSVTFELPPAPLRPGSLAVAMRVEPDPGAARLSVDLVSPTMPMHGIVRSAAERLADGRYLAALHVPMGGRWSVFVNLDSLGADAAELRFDVEHIPPAEGNPHSPSGSSSSTPEPEDEG